jgi:hypothetical protein
MNTRTARRTSPASAARDPGSLPWSAGTGFFARGAIRAMVRAGASGSPCLAGCAWRLTGAAACSAACGKKVSQDGLTVIASILRMKD